MLALHSLLDIYYYIIALYSVQCFKAKDKTLLKWRIKCVCNSLHCLCQVSIEVNSGHAVQGGACGGSAVCRVEGSVPALLQPPRGSYTALQNLALSPRGAPLCCRGPQRGVAPASRLLGGATSYWTGPTTGLTTSYWSSP